MLEHGIEAVAEPVLAAFEHQITEAEHAPVDHKTLLQEEAAKAGWKVTYGVILSEGPAHDRMFTCEAIVDGRRLGTGTGRSKKDAQQVAAAEALAALELPEA